MLETLKLKVRADSRIARGFDIRRERVPTLLNERTLSYGSVGRRYSVVVLKQKKKQQSLFSRADIALLEEELNFRTKLCVNFDLF